MEKDQIHILIKAEVYECFNQVAELLRINHYPKSSVAEIIGMYVEDFIEYLNAYDFNNNEELKIGGLELEGDNVRVHGEQLLWVDIEPLAKRFFYHGCLATTLRGAMAFTNLRITAEYAGMIQALFHNDTIKDVRLGLTEKGKSANQAKNAEQLKVKEQIKPYYLEWKKNGGKDIYPKARFAEDMMKMPFNQNEHDYIVKKRQTITDAWMVEWDREQIYDE